MAATPPTAIARVSACGDCKPGYTGVYPRRSTNGGRRVDFVRVCCRRATPTSDDGGGRRAIAVVFFVGCWRCPQLSSFQRQVANGVSRVAKRTGLLGMHHEMARVQRPIRMGAKTVDAQYIYSRDNKHHLLRLSSGGKNRRLLHSLSRSVASSNNVGQQHSNRFGHHLCNPLLRDLAQVARRRSKRLFERTALVSATAAQHRHRIGTTFNFGSVSFFVAWLVVCSVRRLRGGRHVYRCRTGTVVHRSATDCSQTSRVAINTKFATTADVV